MDDRRTCLSLAATLIPASLTVLDARGFFEPTGALHSTWGSVDANTPARVLVFMVVPNGTSGTTTA